MITEEITKKPLYKKDICAMLNKINSITVRAEIVEVVAEARNVSHKHAKDIKVIYPSEVAKVLKRFE